ncbi:TetR/AcrR family transcriptional regulator [Leptospira sp. 201903074]|uniref:TetR/AcrR family transcriptional regulator n=1 Tax=Leptospira abararensis TaxID=2810036 RepID=UPI001964ED5B|nr:TetR/AcrR family transcriptional regulator [Leptospira abararensis]MBM9547842.1 TetR/AcrR family transcriptional regulator [Leptospira abararensis]
MKQKIIHTALKICEKDGYESFSMRKLATKLALDPMAIYHYFENKDALTMAMVEQIFQRFEKEISITDKNPKSNLKRILVEYWKLFIEYPGMSLYLIKNSYDSFPSVISLNQTLQTLLEKIYPAADDKKMLNILIDFIHGNALSSLSLGKEKIKEITIRSNQRELEFSLSYILDLFSKP